MTEIAIKGWGHEEIFASTEQYCGKILHFNQHGRCSMHFHANKHETWRVIGGKFVVEYLDITTGKQNQQTLNTGDVWVNPPLLPHRLVCLEQGEILEVSSEDRAEDNYRVSPGDSQQ